MVVLVQYWGWQQSHHKRAIHVMPNLLCMFRNLFGFLMFPTVAILHMHAWTAICVVACAVGPLWPQLTSFFVNHSGQELWKILIDFNNFYRNLEWMPYTAMPVSYFLIYFTCDVNMTSLSRSYIIELWQRLLHVWRGLEQLLIDDAVEQWPTRLRACVRAIGGHLEHTMWLSVCFLCTWLTLCFTPRLMQGVMF